MSSGESFFYIAKAKLDLSEARERECSSLRVHRSWCVCGGGGEAKEVVKDNWNLAKVSISKRINSLFVFISK